MRGLQAKALRTSPTEVAVAADDGASLRRLSFEFSAPAAATGDLALPLTLAPSMALGAPLRIEDPVDVGLLERQDRIQSQLAVWSSRLARVPVDASPRQPPESVPGGVGAFFSGGVDSFYTLLTHQAEITHLILIHGFDFPVSDRDTRTGVARMAHRVASALDLELLEVQTDAKHVISPVVPWHWYHGSLLAGIAHALEDHISRALIPASHALRNQVPWGQHPELDPLWSTARVGIETADPEPTRLEKVAVVAGSELAMRWLRVCWERPGEWNCGRCEKCLRTMVDLAVWGRLAECRTLPDTIDVAAVRAIVLRTEGKRSFVRESLEQLRRDGGDGELADALEVALRRSRYRVARERFRRLPAGAVHRARHASTTMRMRLGRSTSR